MHFIEKFICICGVILIPGHQVQSAEVNTTPTDVIGCLKAQKSPKSTPTILTAGVPSLPFQSPYPYPEYPYIKSEKIRTKKFGKTFVSIPQKKIPPKFDPIIRPSFHRSIDGRKRKAVTFSTLIITTQPVKKSTVQPVIRCDRKFNQSYLRQKFERQNG